MTARALLGPILALALWALAVLAVAPGAQAEGSAGAAASDAAERLRAATLALSEARRAPERVAALTEVIRAHEDGLGALRGALRGVTRREAEIRTVFDARAARLSQLLGVLTSIERAPAPLLLIHPAGPLDTARSAMLVGEVLPGLQAEAEVLRRDLEEMVLLEGILREAEASLAGALVSLQDARAELSEAMAERRPLPAPEGGDPARLATLLAGADTLDTFAGGLARLEALAPADSPRSFEAARGTLPLPVQAVVLRGFEEADAAGVRRPGLVLAAPPLSLVTAPWPATLRYAGPLLDYGNVIVLEPAPDYLVIMAGLGDVFAASETIVAAGTPLGLLGGTQPGAGDFMLDATQVTGGMRRETLYMELRHRGTAINPSDWFALP